MDSRKIAFTRECRRVPRTVPIRDLFHTAWALTGREQVQKNPRSVHHAWASYGPSRGRL